MNDCCLPSSQKLLVGALSRMFHLLREQNLAAPSNVGKEKDARWKNGQILGAYAWPIWSIPGLEPTTLARPTFPALLYSRLGACKLQWPGLTFRPATQSTKENSEVNSPEPRWNLITKCCSKIQECVCFPLNLMEIKTFDKNSPWKYFSFYAMLYAS